MKKIILLVSFFGLALVASSQAKIDSLKLLLHAVNNDKTTVRILGELSESYAFTSPDSSLRYGRMAVDLSRRIRDDSSEIKNLIRCGGSLSFIGNASEAIILIIEGKRKIGRAHV